MIKDAAPARGRRLGRWLVWLPLVAAADWLALKSGTVSHPPWVLATLAGAALAALLVWLAALARAVARGRYPRLAGAGLAGLLAGVALALGAGLANWLLALQGFVILHEGEAVPLHSGSHLQHFEGGPLARIDEMDVVLALAEVELVPGAGDDFSPESRIEVQRAGGEPARLTVSRRAGAAHGSLRFFQGAFGFAPRIVLLRGDETLFDRVVPFTSRSQGARGLRFEGSFTLEEQGLRITGAVNLDSLDEAMRGHATLNLSVARGGTLLGRGRLLPGHFAEMAEGYRIGFAGLERWSEIDLSRRHYGQLVVAGAAVALAGAALWLLARWRGW